MQIIDQRTERMARVRLVWEQYAGVSGDDEDVVTDLLTDLLHHCDEMGVDFAAQLSKAEQHHDYEVGNDL